MSPTYSLHEKLRVGLRRPASPQFLAFQGAIAVGSRRSAADAAPPSARELPRTAQRTLWPPASLLLRRVLSGIVCAKRTLIVGNFFSPCLTFRYHLFLLAVAIFCALRSYFPERNFLPPPFSVTLMTPSLLSSLFFVMRLFGDFVRLRLRAVTVVGPQQRFKPFSSLRHPRDQHLSLPYTLACVLGALNRERRSSPL